MKLERRVRIEADLLFDTAFHVGSGREGELGTHQGVLRDFLDQPLLPGSTLKGKFRATVERVAHVLGKTACLLDSSLSGVPCVSDEKYRKENEEEFQKLEDQRLKLAWLELHTCDVCNLFGSPLRASRIFFSDAKLEEWAGVVQVRDGVSLDRDSETARPKLKYDFEVVQAGAKFNIRLDLENPDDRDLALVAIGIAEWEEGIKLGGMTSRGLGSARLMKAETKVSAGVRVSEVDFSKSDQRRTYLTERTLTDIGRSLLEDALSPYLG